MCACIFKLQIKYKVCFLAELPRAPKAPAGGASIGIEINKPVKARKFGCRLRTYVRTYARIRPGDEFVFIFDLESFLRKK